MKKDPKVSAVHVIRCATEVAEAESASNIDTRNTVSTTVCACGNSKRVSKPTCTFCSFINYIRGTKETIPTKVCACGNSKEAGDICCPVCNKALKHYLERRAKYEGLNKAKFLKSMRKGHGIGVAGKCSLCDGHYIFGGNNPQPVIDDYDARCCDKCDETAVRQARINHIKKYGRAY